ncbi:hypothetical protein [Winogradskyella sp.]|uniref:hypothetical protein n=1 Tax=Winogradskyella sp. TaxID=1883156 RepID=UPI0025E32049|nr:hypothetical protein [Winogradskyella sp.]MBT8244146.1 hypothetical protein [Winogradskyella sp.]
MKEKLIKKEKWTSEVLSSINDIQSAVPSENLFNKITQRIQNEKAFKVISFNYLRWTAAAAIIFIAINIYAFNLKAKESKTHLLAAHPMEKTLLTNYSIYE